MVTSARMAPSWISTAKLLPKVSSPKPKKCWTSSRCPVEDTGTNSVSPSTMPRIVAVNTSSSMGSAPRAGRKRWGTERTQSPPPCGAKRGQEQCRLLAAHGFPIGISRDAPDSLPRRRRSRTRGAGTHAVPSSVLPALAVRAYRARRIRHAGATGRGTRVGTPGGFSRAQPGRHHAGAGRRGPPGGSRLANHRRISRRDPRGGAARAPAAAAGHARARGSPPPDRLVPRQILRRGELDPGRRKNFQALYDPGPGRRPAGCAVDPGCAQQYPVSSGISRVADPSPALARRRPDELCGLGGGRASGLRRLAGRRALERRGKREELVRTGEIATVVPADPGRPAAGDAAVADLRQSRFLSDPADRKRTIRELARAHGFEVAGIVRPDAIAGAQPRLAQFLAEGLHGDMAWMETTAERRGDPRALWPEVRSIIMLGLNYGPDRDPLAILKARGSGAISAYAQGEDYHELIKSKLKRIGRALVEALGGEAKVFVDTAAVMEKPLAAAAGLGWQGKHTNLVSLEFGSWLFLGAIFTTLELESDAAESDHCGSCRACLDICPTAAFPAPYRLDARRCIAYLTIEHKGPIPRELRPAIGNRVFGCDDCLAVCPWNKFAKATREAKLVAREELRAPRLADLARLDDAAFRALFAKSPVKRTGRVRFVRNVLIAIGNSGDPALAAEAEHLLDDAAPLVRGAAVWALSRLTPIRLGALAAERRGTEPDAGVQAEWAAALDGSPCPS